MPHTQCPWVRICRTSAVQHKPSTCPGNIKCCAFLRLPKESISKLSLVGSFINTYQPYSTKYLLIETSNNNNNIKLRKLEFQSVEDVRNHHRTKKNAQHKKWKNQRKHIISVNFWFFYSMVKARVQGVSPHTGHRKYLPLEPFLSFPIKVYKMA